MISTGEESLAGPYVTKNLVLVRESERNRDIEKKGRRSSSGRLRESVVKKEAILVS